MSKYKKQQGGFVLILALMILASVAALTTSMLSDLQRNVDKVSYLDYKAEVNQILLGGESWAASRATELFQSPNTQVGHNFALPWVMDSTSFNTDLGGELSITLIDRGSCLDVNDLFRKDEWANAMRAQLVSLSRQHNIDTSWIAKLQDWGDVDQGLSASNSYEDEHYQGKSTSYRTNSHGNIVDMELDIMDLGLNAEQLATLYPNLCFQPDHAPMSFASVSLDVLKGALPEISEAKAEQIHSNLLTSTITSTDEFLGLIGEDQLSLVQWSPVPRYYEVLIQYKQDDEVFTLVSSLYVNANDIAEPVARTNVVPIIKLGLFVEEPANAGAI